MKNKLICIDGNFPAEHLIIYDKYNVKIPIEGEEYTIRDLIINPDENPGLLLQEIVNPKIPYTSHLLGDIDIEPNWSIKKFEYIDGDKIEVLSLANKLNTERRNNRTFFQNICKQIKDE